MSDPRIEELKQSLRQAEMERDHWTKEALACNEERKAVERELAETKKDSARLRDALRKVGSNREWSFAAANTLDALQLRMEYATAEANK